MQAEEAAEREHERRPGSAKALRAEVTRLEKPAEMWRANDRAGVGLRPTGLHEEPEVVYAAIVERVEQLRQEAASARTVPVESTRDRRRRLAAEALDRPIS